MTTIIIILSNIAALLIIALAVVCSRIKVISDEKPRGTRANDRVLKLANEIAPFVKEKDGKIYLKIIK